MAINVKFLQGTQAAYDALAVKDSTTFYRTTDELNLYLGTTKLSNAADLTEALSRVSQLETDVDTLETAVGSLDSLSTTAKSDLVSAINEVLAAVGSGGTDAVVAVTKSTDSSEYAAVYTITQGGVSVGTINIPADMVVSSGEVVVNPEGLDEGTYIALTLANSDSTVIYVNVGDLVDIYTAGEEAAQVQIAISADNVITATLVAGSVGTAELADDAVTTAKIADGNVTLAKLSTGVQTSLGKADTAVQSVTTGTTNGTISVDGTDVAVFGLGSAAYTESSAYDAAGAADQALTDAKAYADELVGDVDVSSQITTAVEALDYEDTAVDGEYVSAVNEVDGVIAVTRTALPDYSETYDAYGAAEQALSDAKDYADEIASTASSELESALTWEAFE